jgi:DNA primase
LTWDELMEGIDPTQLHVRSIPSRISQPKFNPWPKFNKRQRLSARALRSLPRRTG